MRPIFKIKHEFHCFLLAGFITACQSPSETSEVEGIPETQKLTQALLISAEQGNHQKTDSLWQLMVNTGTIPYIFKDSVYFFYKGKADSVFWNGDFNNWGEDTAFNNRGVQIGTSDVWLLKASLPANARIDYKIVVNDQWLLDPAHENYQYSGIGGGMLNSMLAMPKYQKDSISIVAPDKPGRLIYNNIIKSEALNYPVSYQVYLPYGYDSLSNLPVLLLTDGHEFLHNELGNFPNIVDHLIEQKQIEPIVVVFIDPRDPDMISLNKRIKEFSNNPAYSHFLVNELLPEIERDYTISDKREKRALGGVSMGGLNAAFTAHTYPEAFQKLAIMSPAFNLKPEIYDLWQEPKATYDIYLSSGTINDAREEADKFFKLLKSKGLNIKYDSVPQGHNWGNWRDVSDDMLIYLFGKR
jgi:enterochelin esterase-like enzyme